MAGVAAQGRWRRRRPASLVRRHGVDSGGHGTGVRPPFEGSAVLFRGCGTSGVRERVAQCHRVDTGLTAQCRTAVGMASPGGLATVLGYDSQARQRDDVRRFICRCQSIKCLGRGAGTGAASSWGPRARKTSPAGASSPQARRPHPRGRPALERGGTLPEGASSPRARRNLTRGGVQPSSEAGFS
jgi:hypothetical protein